jgi:hypothetical protein
MVANRANQFWAGRIIAALHFSVMGGAAVELVRTRKRAKDL